MRYILLYLVFSNYCLAQNNMRLGAIAEYSENLSIRNISGGINLDIILDKKDRFAINYKFIIGASSDKALYFHAPIGSSAAGYLLSKFGDAGFKEINTLSIFLFFIPEGLTFYPNPDSKLSPGFYINPLGSDYWFKRNDYEIFKVSSEVGGKILMKQTEKTAIHGHVGLRYLYGKKNIDPLFITAGIGLVFADF